ncbi:hypothetical protein CIPAW_08G099300 [Carya illinoinensis]|uniref:Uncharacterized protein n=1 Tax=Carya illinoinensis TaxID=32201 RepID=A0A8T1PUK1_CARIL|nr:hypothetical protein CIPAW_08G099300 [Carya illinoinensis]
MLGFYCSRQLLLLKCRVTQLGFLRQNGFFIVKSFTSVAISHSNEGPGEEKRSFAVSYLINSCGLSTKSAILASKRLQFQRSETPDSVVHLLKENGFTNSQISQIVRIQPSLLSCDPKKVLLPKIEFFRSIGFSCSDVPRILTSNPSLLGRSLEKCLIPCLDFLKSVLLEDEKVVLTVKRAPRVIPFDPRNTIQAFTKITKSKLESKLELYKRWGWSKEIALLAFKRHPNCMLLSDEKITKAMDFLVNEMSWSSLNIARNPTVIFFSLEKRIIPRCSVIQILLAKGLVKSDLSSSTFMLPGERSFLDKFVIKFQDVVPGLRNVYLAKMHLSGLGNAV